MKSFEARDRDDPVEYDGPVHVRVMKSGRIVFHLPDERAGTEPGDPHA